MKRLAAALALAVSAGCSRSSPPAIEKQAGSIVFREAAAQTGLKFHHQNGAKGQFHLVEIMGSGLALFDYDRDGDLDVYLVQGNPAAGGNKLFRNELIPSGQLRFADATAAAGVGNADWGMGAAVGDYDGDGDPDLLVTNYGANLLYRNNGDGTFADVSKQAGITGDGWNTSAIFFDYDRDSQLDLFVARYVDFSWSNAKTCRGPSGALDYCSPKAYRGTLDRLFRNQGNGTFVDVTRRTGINIPAPGLGVAVTDADGDGWPDIYVANDGEANQLWMNLKNGRFKEQALEAGVAYGDDGIPQAGMGLAVSDYNGDGFDDILVTNLTGEGATLYRNTGGGLFEDVSAASGVRKLSFGSTGFGTVWIDANNDGTLELFMTNGAVTRIESQNGQAHPFRQPALLLKQRRGRFVEASSPALNDVGRGAAIGDLDNDGDQDIVINNNNGPARLLLNDSASGGYLRIALNSQQPVGARITLASDAVLSRRVSGGGSYLAASEPVAHFGLGVKQVIGGVTVEWPDGKKERWLSPGVNKTITLKQGTGNPVP